MPFYWWRRFRTHKSLPYKSPLIDKIKNGDFDYSPYFQQAEWELHWMKDEQKEFIQNYQGNDPKQDRLYMDIAEDLVLVAVQQALEKAKELADSETSRVTGGMNLPGMM